MAEKLTRMKADTFRARLRLGLGFDGPVHVPETLKVCDRDIVHLCDAICVDGELDLTGCVKLERLPERLIVRGQLVISDCAKINRLPGTVRELFGFKAVDCRNLVSIEPLNRCHGPMDLRGCQSLNSIPADLRVQGSVKLNGLRITAEHLIIEGSLPDIVKEATVGKRVGQVLSHGALSSHRIHDAIITNVIQGSSDVLLQTDTSQLVIPNKGN